MSRICEICGKTYQKGNLVPRGIGNRVTRRTIRKTKPNLRVKRLDINGKKTKVKLCASCLKKINKQNKQKSEAVAAK